MIHPSASVDIYREAGSAIFQEHNAPISLRLQRFSSTEDACPALAADLGSGACRGLLKTSLNPVRFKSLEPVVDLNDAKGETSSTVSIRSASSLAYRRHWMRAFLFSKMSAPGFLNSMMTSLLAFPSSS